MNIPILRLVNHHLGGDLFETPLSVVSWLGALQAQDLNSAKWAIGVRLKDSTEKLIDEAINNGDIIRTHLMRPTWHMVAADDYLKLLWLTAPNIRSSLKSRRKQLDLDESFFKKSNPTLENILSGGNHLTREELMIQLSMTIPDIDSSRMNHILLEAELDGLICSGMIKNKQHSFALVSERLKSKTNKVDFNRDEAIALITCKYFLSHGPATVKDFSWWSGLSIGDCNKGLEMVKNKLEFAENNKVKYLFNGELNDTLKDRSFLLPAFDEYIISYKDRSSVLTIEHHGRAVSANGIFRPVMVLDGQVVGLWNKSIKKDVLQIKTEWFLKPQKSIIREFEEAGLRYATFLGLKYGGMI